MASTLSNPIASSLTIRSFPHSTTSHQAWNPWVAKLVKSFEALYEITESLHDFRYEPIYDFSFEDALEP